MTKLLFVTGTDTEVGKTYVASALSRSLRQQGVRVGVYKPVASGCIDRDGGLVSEDAESLWEAAGRPLSIDAVCPQLFQAPLAPPRAASAAGEEVDAQRLLSGLDSWREGFDIVIVEGAGGFMSPLADGVLNADFARAINADVMLVAANRLGTINHTLLSIEACSGTLERDPIAIVLSQVEAMPTDSCDTNAGEISRYARHIDLYELPFQEEVDSATAATIMNHVTTSLH